VSPLRLLSPADLPQLVEVYRDAVLSQTPNLYAPEQVQAWAEHANLSGALVEPLQAGYGLASLGSGTGTGTGNHDHDHDHDLSVEAFGILHPEDRLALLYCRGRSNRQGRAGAILSALEQQAGNQGVKRLRTEASQLSRPLLERRGWQVDAEETVLFAGIPFVRWRMVKELASPGEPIPCPLP
jgi:putative acetyltransferase